MIVLESARGLGIPVAVVFAGGYARDIQDSVDVHINTIRAAQKVARKWPKQ
jgi:acetoin utilization deacetylase AcuC-like enzyme